jgi:hypothetical protein
MRWNEDGRRDDEGVRSDADDPPKTLSQSTVIVINPRVNRVNTTDRSR